MGAQRGLWNHPTRSDWEPGNGGLCLHTIAPWPGDPSKLLVAISAVGVWLTDDGGETWRHSNTGIVPRYLPEEARADRGLNHCVHDVRRSPARPERLFMQFHDGVYRSDDAGAHWIDIGTDTGPPLRLRLPDRRRPGRSRQRLRDPADRGRGPDDPRRQRPGVGDARRRRLVDAARRGPAEPRRVPHRAARGVRQRRRGRALELYFGSTSGEVFGSGDAGASWAHVAEHLPPVYSVRTA